MSGSLLVVAGALVRDGRLLLARRPDGDPLAGLWELPGGKVEPGETPEAALEREWSEELGVRIDGVGTLDVRVGRAARPARDAPRLPRSHPEGRARARRGRRDPLDDARRGGAPAPPPGRPAARRTPSPRRERPVRPDRDERDRAVNDTLLLLLFAVCLVASSFFSGSETALTTLSDAAVFRLKEKKHPQAVRLERLRGRLPQTISTLLIGNTLVNIAAGSIGTVLAIEAFGERWGVLTATVATTLLLLVFGEVTPKTLASRQAEGFACLGAPVHRPPRHAPGPAGQAPFRRRGDPPPAVRRSKHRRRPT